MRKVKLSLDGLAVESFATVAESGEYRGTVQGFATKPWQGCPFQTADTCADPCPSDAGSCAGTCVASCAVTCDYTCPATCAATCAFTCDDPTCASCDTYCGQVSCVIHCP